MDMTTIPNAVPTPSLPLEAFQLFDIAEATALTEAEEWSEDPGMSLFLEDTIVLLRRELELMPQVCGARSGERARVFVMAGHLSQAAANSQHYRDIAQHADVWIFGVPDQAFAPIPGVTTIALTEYTSLARERSVIIDSPSFGVALFAIEAGRLEDDDEDSRYFEG